MNPDEEKTILGEIVEDTSAYDVGALSIREGMSNGIKIYSIKFNYRVKAGTIGREEAVALKKIICQERVEPAIIYLFISSGGARIDHGIDALEELSSLVNCMKIDDGNILVSIVDGVAAGGAALLTFLSDIVLLVEKRSNLFIHGPKICKEIINREISPQELGGTHIHNEYTIRASYTVKSWEELTTVLPRIHKFIVDSISLKKRRIKALETRELKIRRGNRLREIIRNIFDRIVLELYPKTGREIISTLAYLGNTPVAVIGTDNSINMGRIGVPGLIKIRRSLGLIEKFRIPLIYIVDSPGLLDTPEEERKRIIDEFIHTLKYTRKYRDRTISVIYGGCYGPSYILFSSLNLSTSRVLIWRGQE